MSQGSSVLDFAAVDGVAFAAERGRLNKVPTGFVLNVERLGPLVELTQLAKQHMLPAKPRWLNAGALTALRDAILDHQTNWSDLGGNSAMMALPEEPISNAWTNFAMGAKRAALGAGFDRSFAGQMVAALRELEDNIREHAGTIAGASLSYHAQPGIFEFAVADQGCGVLATLRSFSGLACFPMTARHCGQPSRTVFLALVRKRGAATAIAPFSLASSTAGHRCASGPAPAGL